MKDSIIIRTEKEKEYREVENLVRESFWNVYRPGCLEHYVLHQLRKDAAFVPELDFVMEMGEQIIGQNMFMKAEIQADDGRKISIMTMGPICIVPDLKRKGYGKILLDYSLEKAKELGCGAICMEGNIDFTEKAATDGQVSLESVIMGLRKTRMLPFSCAGSLFRDISMALQANMRRRRAIM